MAYITREDYIKYYGDLPLTDKEFPVYAGIASDVIDMITQYRVAEGGGISAFPVYLQELIKKAVSAQVLYFTQNGGIETVLSGQSGQGFTVGKVRIDGVSSASSNSRSRTELTVSPIAAAILEQSYLMERGIPCYGLYRADCLPITWY